MIRIGTRKSSLAIWQANHVKNKLEKLGFACTLVTLKSSGDQDLIQPLYSMGIQGIFTKTLDHALLNDSIDIAVHSLKDVPTLLPEGIIISAYLERGAVNDVMVYHKDFINPNTLNNLKFCRGLKYFLNGFIKSQQEIETFVEKCKASEDTSGFLCNNFYQLKINSKYKFITGPFTEKIFKIINLQKNKIDIFMGNVKISIKKKEFLFNPA